MAAHVRTSKCGQALHRIILGSDIATDAPGSDIDDGADMSWGATEDAEQLHQAGYNIHGIFHCTSCPATAVSSWL